jgi:APA family basic amino acid/polyamine antiporter
MHVCVCDLQVTNPSVDLPVGIVGTLVIVTVLYTTTALVVTGMQHWATLSSATPLASAFVGVGQHWASILIAAVTVTACRV